MNIIPNQNIQDIENVSDKLFMQLLVAFSIVIALLTYGYEISSFSLSIDEEVQSFDSNIWLTWISQGRWGMGILTYILPDGLATMPFLPTFLFATGLALSAVMFSTIFTNSKVSAMVYVGVFVSSPIWLHIGEFNTLSWGFSLALIVTAIAVKLIKVGGGRNAIIAGICVGFSLAVYQALFILYLTSVLLICINKEWGPAENQNSSLLDRNAMIFVDLFKSIIVTVIFYFFMNKIFIYMTDSNLTYLNNFINLSAYTSGDAGITIEKVINQTKGLLIGTDHTFLRAGIPSLLLFWIGTVFAIKNLLYSEVSIITKTYVFVLSIGVLLLAIFLIILSAGSIPTRALIVFPVLYATLSAFSFKYKNAQKLLWIIFGAMLFTNIYIANTLFYADHIARQRDLVMATRLINLIEDVGGESFGEKIPIAIVGSWQHELGGPAHRVEIFGESFFEHDGGNPYRVVAYLRLLGCQGLVPLHLAEIENELKDIKLRPSWPKKEAVFLTQSAVIVKLSEPSYQQEQTLHNK